MGHVSKHRVGAFPNAPLNVEKTRAFDRCIDTVRDHVDVRGDVKPPRPALPASAPPSPILFTVAGVVFLALVGAVAYLRERWRRRQAN